MKKLSAILLATAFTVGACGGSTPDEPAEKGIAALDEKKEKAPEKDTKAGGRKKPPDSGKGKGGTSKPAQPKTSGGSSQPSGGGSDDSSGGEDGGGGGTQAQAAPAPVPQGEYEYATQGQRTVSGNSSSLPKTTTLTAGAPASGVQRQARDLRDSEGNGTLTETDLVYRPGGVYLSYVKVTSRFQGGLTDVREFELPQPQLIAPAGGGPGFTRSFTMEGSGTRAKVSIKAHRWENVAAGGREVRSLVVETDIRFSGALEGYQRSIGWFWPEHLLTIKEQVQTDVRNGPIRLQSTYRAQIEQLSP